MHSINIMEIITFNLRTQKDERIENWIACISTNDHRSRLLTILTCDWVVANTLVYTKCLS